jgi:putative peptidoglycan lipid II flippase
LALVFSLANLLEAGVLGFLLAQRIGGMGRALWDGLVRMLLAGVPTLALMVALRADSAAWLTFIEPAGVYFWPGDFLLLLIWLAVVGAIGAGAYAAMAWFLAIPELRALIARIRR